MKSKKVQKKRYKKKMEAKEKTNPVFVQEIKGILVLALGILMLLSFYVEHAIGLFGDFIRQNLLGLFGIPALLIPPTVVFYGFYLIFKHQEQRLAGKTVYGFLLFLLLSALVQAIFYDPDTYGNLKPLRSIGKFYDDGIKLSGGGVLGGVISLPFLSVFRLPGTLIILTALSLVNIILLTNASIANFLRNFRTPKPQKADIRKKGVKPAAVGASDMQGFDAEIVGDPDNLSLQFNAKPKVIDFRIEKTARELKEKTGGKKAGKLVSPVREDIGKLPEEGFKIEGLEPEELFIQDIKDVKKKSSKSPAADKDPVKDAKKTSASKTGAGQEEKEKIEPLDPALLQQQPQSAVAYKYPPVDLLKEDPDAGGSKNHRNQVIEGAKKLEETLASFGVSAKVINVTRGPTVTRYELQPSAGVKVSRIVNLSDDIALNLAASGVRIEAPIPGKAAIGIEVPNREVTTVLLRDVIESDEFSQHASKIAFGLGRDISGECIVADIGRMPHLLIAGATGSGKSVCINSLVVSLLYKASPEEVKLLMVDPKVVELGIYNGIPHLLIPVVTDPKKAAGALNWAVQEMVNRYKLFADKGVRDLKGYNELMKKTGESSALPQVVIIIDELADLMMVAPNDVEDSICRLAQMARAAGMHLVIATQRPSVDVITGVIKANIPSRISFAVSSQIDSRTVLDMAGAEKLLGRGDMLFHPVGKPKPIRVQGANVTDAEVERVVEFVKSQGSAVYDDTIIEEINSENGTAEGEEGDNDELLPRAIEVVMEAGQASVSLIQRKFKVGYARAARIIDQMETRGIIGGFEGSKPRQILISRQQWQELQMADRE